MLLAATWGATRNRRTGLRVAGFGGLLVGAGFVAIAAIAMLRDGDLGRGFFFGYLGAVLIGTGRSMGQRIALRDMLAAGTVADAMRPPSATVPASASLSDALDLGLRAEPDRPLPVTEAGRVIGTISMASARRVGARDPLRPVRDATAPLTQGPVVAPADSLDDAFEWIAGREALVLRDGALVGVIGPADVERWYRHRYEPGAPASTEGPPPRPDV
jgi:hypothetical protein